MNKIIRSLLNDNPKALKVLHDTFNFDYNKPFEALYIENNFTINQIFKALHHTGKMCVVALTKDPNNFCFPDEYKAVQIFRGGSFNIEFSKRIPYQPGKNRIDDYSRKSDFEATRKHTGTKTYVIAQPIEFLTADKKHDIDYSQRFKYIPPTYENAERTSFSHGNGYYISNIQLQETTSNGYKFEYKPSFYHGNEYKNVSEIIDKSGYIVSIVRMELNDKAHALKADRDKEKYLKTDNQEKIDNLEILVTNKRHEIAAALNAATTHEAVKAIEKKLSFFRGLSDAMYDLENMKVKDKEKKYRSVEHFMQDYNHIIETINNI